MANVISEMLCIMMMHRTPAEVPAAEVPPPLVQKPSEFAAQDVPRRSSRGLFPSVSSETVSTVLIT